MDQTTLDQLDRDDRLRLLRFVCSFAWADFRIQPEERELIVSLIDRMQLEEAERVEVRQWLELPPGDTDPTAVPAEHRQLFRDAIRATIEADGEVTSEELETMSVFDQLVRD